MTEIVAAQALLPDGWAENVAISISADGRIASARPGQGPATHATVLPAPANLHSHAFQRAMAGLSEARGTESRDTFWTWRQIMYRFLDLLDPDDIRAIAAQVQMEMLEAGFATNVEFHYLHHRPDGRAYDDHAEMSAQIAAAAAQTGIGLTLLPVHYQFGGCDGRPLAPGQRRFGTTPDSFAALVDAAETMLEALPADAGFGIAPHSLRAVSPQGLAICETLRPQLPLHMHVAEQIPEIEEVRAAHGARPVEWLLDHAGVDGRWTLIHCTHMSDAETHALAATGATAGVCPITEASLGDGIFNGAAWCRAGGRFGFGSDSNIRISLAEELRMLEYSQRLRDRARAVLATRDRSTGRVLFDAALAGGAAASGRECGAIRPGLWADLVALRGQDMVLTGRSGDRVLDSWVFAGGQRQVADVWAAGRHVVQDGRHIARDAISKAYHACLTRLTDLL